MLKVDAIIYVRSVCSINGIFAPLSDLMPERIIG